MATHDVAYDQRQRYMGFEVKFICSGLDVRRIGGRMASVNGRAGNDLSWIVRSIRKHLLGIVLLVIVAAAAMTAYVILREDEYTAYTEILIEPEGDSFGDLAETVDRGHQSLEPVEIETALKLVTSGRTLQNVIDKLNLVSVPDRLLDIKEMINDWFKAEALEGSAPETSSMVMTLRNFRERLTIERDPLASIITVGYRSANAEEAALVVNTLAELYLAERLTVKRQVFNKAAEHLDTRVKEMSDWLRAAEAEIERYKADADLYEVGGAAPVEQRYTKLNDQLTEANIALTEAQARLSQADRTIGNKLGSGDLSGIDLDSIKEVQVSPVIADLRRQETELRRRMGDLSSQYGNNHPSMRNAQAELNGMRASIEIEIKRIVEQLKLETIVADHRVQTIKEKLDKAQSALDSSQESRIRLRELERDVEGPRQVYEVMLDRFQRAREQEKLVTDTARIISPAIVPDRPSNFSGKLLIGIVILGVGTAGTGFALLREFCQPGYLDAASLEAELDCAVLGLVPFVRRMSNRRQIEERRSLETFAYVEAVRGIINKVMPNLSPGDETPIGKVLSVTSCFPDEGKTMLTLSLARQASFGGLRVLLIEGDLRKAGLREDLTTIKATAGLIQVLTGEASTLDAIQQEPGSKVDVLLGFGPDKDAFRLTRSSTMKALIEQAKLHYDLVLIDCGPALAVSDTRSLMNMTDEVIFVVRWKTTERAAVTATIRDIEHQKIPIAGVVMTQIDLVEHMKYGEADQLRYQDKYHDYAATI